MNEMYCDMHGRCPSMCGKNRSYSVITKIQGIYLNVKLIYCKFIGKH